MNVCSSSIAFKKIMHTCTNLNEQKIPARDIVKGRKMNSIEIVKMHKRR
jgi:hypothetical protein